MGAHILVVEDEEKLARFVELELLHEGYLVSKASNGREALEIALAGDFAPGFFIKHFIKDMKIVQEESRKSGVELEMLDTVLALYEKMAQQGLENDGTQALIKYYQK